MPIWAALRYAATLLRGRLFFLANDCGGLRVTRIPEGADRGRKC